MTATSRSTRPAAVAEAGGTQHEWHEQLQGCVLSCCKVQQGGQSYLESVAPPGVAAGVAGLLVAAGVAIGVDPLGMSCAEVLLVAASGKLLAADGAAAGTMLGALAEPECNKPESLRCHMTARCQLFQVSARQNVA